MPKEAVSRKDKDRRYGTGGQESEIPLIYASTILEEHLSYPIQLKIYRSEFEELRCQVIKNEKSLKVYDY